MEETIVVIILSNDEDDERYFHTYIADNRQVSSKVIDDLKLASSYDFIYNNHKKEKHAYRRLIGEDRTPDEKYKEWEFGRYDTREKYIQLENERFARIRNEGRAIYLYNEGIEVLFPWRRITNTSELTDISILYIIRPFNRD